MEKLRSARPSQPIVHPVAPLFLWRPWKAGPCCRCEQILEGGNKQAVSNQERGVREAVAAGAAGRLQCLGSGEKSSSVGKEGYTLPGEGSKILRSHSR